MRRPNGVPVARRTPEAIGPAWPWFHRHDGAEPQDSRAMEPPRRVGIRHQHDGCACLVGLRNPLPQPIPNGLVLCLVQTDTRVVAADEVFPVVTRADQRHPVHLSLAHAVAHRAAHLGACGDAGIGCRQGISTLASCRPSYGQTRPTRCGCSDLYLNER